MDPVLGRVLFTLAAAGLIASTITLLASPSEAARMASLLLLAVSSLVMIAVVVAVRREIERLPPRWQRA